ncbi:hypothetical protein BC835DRAFT_1409767 [Cytidiella melzeri]|nr:hypothetical protein BC835DRAFT_1409767 [Cytidiella melzeri]
MVLAARGVIPSNYKRVVRISHREHSKADNDITLVLECSSGKRYSAIWRNAMAVTDTTETLHFVEEAGEAPSLIGVDTALTSSEAACYRSDDKKWVLDGQEGRRILWIPPVHRGGPPILPSRLEGRWYEERLALGDRLLLVDFSGARLDDSPF